jgi:uncharacterized protein (TIGR02145 family)
MVALGIIGIILSLTVVSISNIRQNTRNTERISDIKQIQAALELYRTNEGGYPTSITIGEALASGSTTYMNIIPSNPVDDSAVCPTSDFIYTKVGTSYTLEFCLTKSSGNLTAGLKCATTQGVLDQACFTCGDNLTYGGESYPTILINDQCWTAKNLNIGTKVNSGNSEPACHDVSGGGSGYWSCQINPATVEKYCQNDDASSECATYGGLYEWAEAMGFPYQCNNADFSSGSSNCGTGVTYTVADEHQGICPAGWHVANYADTTILYTYLGGASVAGGKMKEAGTVHWTSPNTGADNSSGFNGLPGGYRNSNGAYFSFQYNGIFSMSTAPTSAINGGLVDLVFNDTLANEYNMNRVAGLSIRCVKN